MDVRLPNGKIIKGVPEGTPKDVIQQKAISAGLASPEDFGQRTTAQDQSIAQTGQEPFQPMQQGGQPQDQSFLSSVGQAVSNAASGLKEAVTGEQRTGRDIQRTPSLFQGDFLSDVPAADKAKIVALAQLTSDPNELAQIVAQQLPDTQIQYNKDEQGNVYPVLRRGDGRAAMVDKPGFDLLNAAQLAADMAVFTPAGRAGPVLKGMAGATATEAARQGIQQQSGGEFNPGQVALSGGLELGGRVLQKGLGAAYRGIKGQPTQDVQQILEAGKQYNVPVMTTDVVPPKTAVGRASQMIPETVPIVGTGGLRAAQQEARDKAVSDFVDRFSGGNYESIISSLKAQKDKIKSAAGKTYDRIIPKLNAASETSGGIGFNNTQKAIENASEILTRPGRKTSGKAVDLLSDIQETVTGPNQTFQNVKTNLGAWQEALDSVDPAIRSQLTSEDKAVLSKVLSAIRKDRDQFAQANLGANEFRQLKNADQAYGEMARTVKKSRLKNVLDKGDMTPEIARNLLFSNKPSEVKQLYGALTNEGRANARATIITDIADRLSRRASGITPDSLATELGKRKEVLDVFFRGQNRRELNGFIKLLNATRRAQKAESTFSLPTGQQAIPYIVGAGTVVEPSVAAAYGTVGALGRLYESPRVRGIMARLASADPGSTTFESLIKQYRQEASKIAQSLKDKGQPNDTNSNQ